MDLLLTPFSELNLCVNAEVCGNIARFISGVNTERAGWRREENIRPEKNEVAGQTVVIFSAKRDIQPGEVLRLNYNSGIGDQHKSFPDEHFH